MVAGISGISMYAAYSMNPYRHSLYPATQARGAAALSQQLERAQQTAQRGSLTVYRSPDLETPVPPVDAAKKVLPDAEQPLSVYLPVALSAREGADPAEMAVRMRIQPYEENQEALAFHGGEELLGLVNEAADEAEKLFGLSEETAEAQGVEGAQKALEEGECETCEKRKYQDGSDDMSVSFQTPTNIKPEQVASAVRGHEMEHVIHEQAKARQEDRKVVSQSVTIHTDICPECGKVYISGGETRTVTKANPEEPDPVQEDDDSSQMFAA